jgi:NitT/TauT family transport system permease protein
VKRTINQIVFVVGLLVLWEALALMKLWPPYVFPTPGGVAVSLADGFKDHSIWIGIAISMRRVILGYVISVVLGMLLGILLTWSEFLDDTVGRLVLSLQSLPSLCWLPMAVLWFGLTEKAIIFVVVMGTLLAVTQNTKAGFDNVPRILSMAGRNLGAKGPQLFQYVLVPASLPYLVDGLRQGWAFAWRSLIQGEMVFVTVGLGQLLMVGRELNDINQVFAVMILIAALGYAVDTILFRKLELSIRQKWGIAAAASK